MQPVSPATKLASHPDTTPILIAAPLPSAHPLSLARYRDELLGRAASVCVMRDHVTESEIESYRRDGFLVMPDFLTPAELESWREIVDRAVAGRGRTVIPGVATADPDDPEARAKMSPEGLERARYYQQVFTQRVNLWQT